VDKLLFPEPEYFEWYLKAERSAKMDDDPFAIAKEIITAQLIMVIPITKQRLCTCLVAFIFVAVFNSLLFMVVTRLRP
jgi:hypothetical protein